MDDYYTMFRSGMWRLRYKLSGEGRTRLFQEFLPKLHETKSKALGADDDNNSWYLVYIGTRPGSQNRGYAKALIEMVTTHVSAKSAAIARDVCTSNEQSSATCCLTERLNVPIGRRRRTEMLPRMQSPGQSGLLQASRVPTL